MKGLRTGLVLVGLTLGIARAEQPIAVQVGINGQPTGGGPTLHLPAREHGLRIDLTCPKGTEAIWFQLQGRDTVWFSVDSHSTFYYDNLSGGQYRIRLRRRDGKPLLWRAIQIDNALWQEWWFAPMLFAYGLVVMGIAMYLFYRYRLRQLVRLQHVRDRIARDLHDDMGSYLSSISILSQTAHRSALRDPVKTQDTLDRIGQTARQVMESMGDIVWSINPSHDSMEQVVARMTDVAGGLFSDTDPSEQAVTLHIDVAPEVRQLSLSAECRRDFFLIYKEAVTNVARYAQASRVRIALQRVAGLLELTVQDNGRGFCVDRPERQNPAGGNGLRNMHTRAALLNGTLTVESALGIGTTLVLRMPV